MMLYNGDTDLRLNVFSLTSTILQIYHLQHHPTNLLSTTSSTNLHSSSMWNSGEPCEIINRLWNLILGMFIDNICTCRYPKYMYSGPNTCIQDLPWCSCTPPSDRSDGVNTLHLEKSSDVVLYLQNYSRFRWPSSTIVILPDHHPEHMNVSSPPLIHDSEC